MQYNGCSCDQNSLRGITWQPGKNAESHVPPWTCSVRIILSLPRCFMCPLKFETGLHS
jgi:hypothetical protein